MRKTVFLLFALVLLFAACKKKDPPQDSLQFYANEIKIYPLNIYGKEAVLSFVERYTDPDATAKFQIKASSATEWRDVPYMDKNNIPVSGLNTKTQYDARVVLEKNGVQKYSPVIQFTTQSFKIDYDRFFNAPAYLHDEANGLFSIEGAKYTIYGSGFMNEPVIKVRMRAVDDTTDVLTLNAVILSDTTLSFQIPAELISDAPFQKQKIYSCWVGEVPLIGYSSYTHQNFDVVGDLYVINRAIGVSKFTVVPSSCTIIHFEGYFGTHESETKCPAYQYGVSLFTKERKVMIYSGSTLVKEINMNSYTSAICEGTGFSAPDWTALNRQMLQYHEVTDLSIRTNMAPGNYSVQIRQVTLDGTVLLSNMFPFTL